MPLREISIEELFQPMVEREREEEVRWGRGVWLTREKLINHLSNASAPLDWRGRFETRLFFWCCCKEIDFRNFVVLKTFQSFSSPSFDTKTKEHEFKIKDVKLMNEIEEKQWKCCSFYLHPQSSLFLTSCMLLFFVNFNW